MSDTPASYLPNLRPVPIHFKCTICAKTLESHVLSKRQRGKLQRHQDDPEYPIHCPECTEAMQHALLMEGAMNKAIGKWKAAHARVCVDPKCNIDGGHNMSRYH